VKLEQSHLASYEQAVVTISEPIFRTLPEIVREAYPGEHPELVEGCDLGQPASFDRLRMLGLNLVPKGAKFRLRSEHAYVQSALQNPFRT
jgi:hypothetical protein